MTEKFQDLVRWIEKNGGYVDNDIYLYIYENGDRCLKTQKYKEDKAVLFRIPYECNIQGKSWYEICIKLLSEFSKGKESFYYPYLCMLPPISDFKNYSLFKYNEDEIFVIENLNKECGRILKDWYKNVYTLEQIIKNLSLPEKFKTKEMLKYVISLYNTRSFGSLGLVPVIDMLQHSQNNQSCNVVMFLENEGVVDCTVKLNPEDTLTYCYRPGGMADLYTTYGIPILDVNYFCACLQFPNITDKQKKQLKMKEEDKNVKFYFSDSGLDSLTFQRAKILSMSEDEKDEKENLNQKALELILQILDFSFEEEYPVLNDRYKIFHDITAKQNEIIRKSIEDFQSVKNL